MRKLFLNYGTCFIFILINISPAANPLPGNQTTQNLALRLTAPPYFAIPTIVHYHHMAHDTLYYLLGKRQLALPSGAIKKCEIQGVKSNTLKGGLFGGFAGGLLLGATAAISVKDDEGWFTPSPGEAFLAGALVGGGVGTLLGVIIGHGSHGIAWRDIPVDSLQSHFSHLINPPGRRTATPLPTQQEVAQISSNKKDNPDLPGAGSGSPLAGHLSGQISRRWEFTINLGTSSSGPRGDIEQSLRRNDWDNRSPGGWFSTPRNHPYSETGIAATGIPWNVSLRYRINSNIGLGALISNTPIGTSKGYRSDVGYLSLDYDVSTVAPLIYLDMPAQFQIGIGPALYQTECRQTSSNTKKYSSTRLGFLLDLKFVIPQKSLFFVAFDTQYRWIPEAKAGPFEEQDYDQIGTLPEFKLNYSHVYFGLGIGLRFSD